MQFVRTYLYINAQCRQGKNAEESTGNSYAMSQKQVEAVESTEGKPEDSECRREKKAGDTARRSQTMKAAWRTAFEMRYHTNVAFRESKKARSKARSKAEYEANLEAKKARSKALSRKAYLDAVKRARKIVPSRRYYCSAKVFLSQYRKAKYVLSEPKPSVQHLYVNSLKAKLLGDRNLAAK